MKHFAAHDGIKEFLKIFRSIKFERADCWYRIRGTNVSMCHQRIEYGFRNLGMYIVQPKMLHSNRLINSIVYVQPMGEVPPTALYDTEYYIVTENNQKVHHFKRKDYPTFSTDDVFNLSTLGKYSTDSLNSLLLLSHILEEYNLDSVELRPLTLLSIVQDHPEVLCSPWELDEYEDYDN